MKNEDFFSRGKRRYSQKKITVYSFLFACHNIALSCWIILIVLIILMKR